MRADVEILQSQVVEKLPPGFLGYEIGRNTHPPQPTHPRDFTPQFEGKADSFGLLEVGNILL